MVMDRRNFPFRHGDGHRGASIPGGRPRRLRGRCGLELVEAIREPEPPLIPGFASLGLRALQRTNQGG